MMFAWQKLADARGVKRWPYDMRSAMKIKQCSRDEMVRRGETASFVKITLLTLTIMTLSQVLGLHVLGRVSLVRPSQFFMKPESGILLTNTVLCSLGMGWYCYLWKWRNAACATLALTRAGLCASCGYSLSELAPKADGCTVCPECGAAWRLNDADA